MMEWEYKVVNALYKGVPTGDRDSAVERFEAGLNKFGLEGWEFCACPSSSLLVFKRQIRAKNRKNDDDSDEKHTVEDNLAYVIKVLTAIRSAKTRTEVNELVEIALREITT